MNRENLVILNNEKVFEEEKSFFCENLDLKVVPEGLHKYFNVTYLVRKSKKKGGQQIFLEKVLVASNIIFFIYNLITTFKDNNKYLIISITPYTFMAYLFLFIFKKKIYLYLWSDGYEEWEHLIGKWAVWIFHLMYLICTFKSEIIVCNKRLSKKKSHLISISRLDEEWFENQIETSSENAKFLYVGRFSKEKGIFDFIKMFEKNFFKETLSIAGNTKNFKFDNPNIKLLGYISESKSLIRAYDSNNITILPSYTEGYPYVVDESLARKRPVIIFEEIAYILNNKKGIFIAKRNIQSLRETVNYILKNYKKIQDEMNKNNLPTKKSMIKQISDIIKI
jgi:glycosyltransferase involved in cell wall biosynthesis